MENVTTVNFFGLFGFQETWMNRSVYFPLTLVTYLLIILVNLTLTITIIMERSLHEPMYIFLCNLCINSLYGTVGFYPMFLKELLSDVHVISYGACLTQAYVIYTSVLCEMTILSVMAFDRYVAICRPLQYHTIVTPFNVGRLLLFAWLYPLLSSAISLIFTIRLPLCGSSISKVFCDNPSIIRHSCVAITVNRVWSNIFIAGHALLGVLIIYSYGQITRVCFDSAEGRIKFTQTCVPHVLTTVVFIIVSLFDVFYSWYNESNIPQFTRNATAVQFLVIPPVFNPLIYGFNLKLIQRVLFSKCKINHTAF